MKRPVYLLIVTLLAPSRLAGQEAPSPVDPAKLPVSVSRIRQKLAEAPASTQGSILKLDFYVDVYGTAPIVDLFAGVDLKNGPVPNTAPTHQEFLDFVTPEEFRSPPADLLKPALALLKWLMQRGAEKKKKP